MRLLFAVLLATACGQPPPKPDGGTGGPVSTTQVQAACGSISIEEWTLGTATHVAVGTAIAWPSNPPSSGPHFPQWAAFQEYSSPVPRGYYVHDLEHGAVVLLYNCELVDAATCDAIKSALRAASTSIGDDVRCNGTGARVRTVITPDAAITEPLVAVSWGFIYRASCVDQPSLDANLCAAGVTSF